MLNNVQIKAGVKLRSQVWEPFPVALKDVRVVLACFLPNSAYKKNNTYLLEKRVQGEIPKILQTCGGIMEQWRTIGQADAIVPWRCLWPGQRCKRTP